MANYATIQKGSQGNDTKRWQEFLITQGYDLKADGIFGDITDKYTKAFQKANGLTVDGIVGKNTWGAYEKVNYSNTSNSTTTTTTPQAPTKPTFNTTPTAAPTIDPTPTAPTYDTTSWDDTEKGKNTGKAYGDAKDAVKNYGPYTESEIVKAAKNALAAHMANKPGEYQSQWQNQLDDVINKILNREQFSYDFNGDALYQQYKDKYIQQGKMAMADTMGQAAAMTGGYGNSYAQSVGQQMYQKEMQNLNDIIPELYQMAYDRYNQEGQDLYNQYGMISDRENTDYGRYRDTVSDWQTERDYLTGRYDTERNFDYGQYQDDYDKLLDVLGIAKSDYYDGADMFYTEQSNKNSVAGQEFDDAMDIWNANTNQKWKEAEWTEQQRKDANDLAQKDYDNAYGEYRDQVTDKQWQDEMDRLIDNDKTANDQWDKEFEAKYGTTTENEVLTEGSDEYWDNYNSKYESGNYNNGTLSQDQIKQLQKALGVTSDGLYGEKSKKAAGGLSAEEAYKKFVTGATAPKEETADDYADWDATDWEGFFATIRNTKGKAAAEEELNRMAKAGLIPQKMLTYAGIGARGSLGH